jgi:hypothetical protein
MFINTPYGVPGDEQFYSFVPKGNSTSLYASEDQLFPVMYFKYNSYQSYQEYNSGSQVFEGLSLPNIYKGKSTLFKIDSVLRYQFDTLTIQSVKDAIVTGSSASFVIPWAGTPINKP